MTKKQTETVEKKTYWLVRGDIRHAALYTFRRERDLEPTHSYVSEQKSI
jgi:hypothetical protein